MPNPRPTTEACSSIVVMRLVAWLNGLVKVSPSTSPSASASGGDAHGLNEKSSPARNRIFGRVELSTERTREDIFSAVGSIQVETQHAASPHSRHLPGLSRSRVGPDHVPGNDEFHAPVLLPPSGGGVIGGGLQLAEPSCRDRTRRDALLHQILLDGSRALLRELLIVGIAADGVGVPLDLQVQVG